MQDRYERQQYGYNPRQTEQFEDRQSGQPGETVADYERTEVYDTGQMGTYGGDSRRDREFAQDRRRGERRPRNEYYRDQYGNRDRGLASSRHDRPDRDYGRFTSESYGGRDYVDPLAYAGYGMAGAGMGYTPTRGAQYREGYGYDDRRPFLERAGDEIASWFGDDDAARRREMDHRGNGPQGYRRSDERILEDVCDRLTEDRRLDARNVTVTVQDSEVTLDGTVEDRAAKRRAEDIADYASGVNHVQNNLRVGQARSEYETRTTQETTS
ncbi:BON domain-containing protein [Croceicoccus naphthovorans]|uniref:Uncharacterized protein n=1 Tax=Croceicoccus naphthovorans TaxID=1348774 RepID=A0A0G3XH18_9SPHN|nr:BON domain-containing protein [Croceicoccus naphthovorans]AKM10830.1 hypothetical protein AB433_14025 [Croceicoccus naphthovorans]MBB3989046.1 osmotically-inducible protein OsmY [Croceicoccus naphthovorans]